MFPTTETINRDSQVPDEASEVQRTTDYGNDRRSANVGSRLTPTTECSSAWAFFMTGGGQYYGSFAKKLIRFVGIVVAQLLILIFASSWLGVEIEQQSISFNGFLTQTDCCTTNNLDDRGHPDGYSAFLGIYCEAIRHFLWKPRPLVQVSAGVALVKGSHIFRPEYLKLTLITWVMFGVLKLLFTGWTTLLGPTLVSCYYDPEGTELSITSPAFSQLLAVELDAYAPTIIHDDSFPIIDVGGSVSGIAAAGVSFGMLGIVNFNEAKYNLSTGGLLPVVQSFAGSTTPPGTNGTRLQFSGGVTSVNTTISQGSSSSSPKDWLGIQRNFTVYQQGITADITCQTPASSQLLNFTNTNITLDVTSPGMYSSDRYAFVPYTICEVTPLITTTRVDYTAGGIINASDSEIISNQTFSPDNTYLPFYLAGVANYHARNSQGLMNNIIGDTLYSIYSSNNTDEVYKELEKYWRGVIAFSATFLLAGYSAQGAFQDEIHSNMTSPVNGTVFMRTIAAILVESWKERHDPWKQTSFDVSDTRQLIMASAEGGLAQNLYGFDKQGLNDNDKIKVKLAELKNNRKKLDVVKEDPEP
ncbi:hypothetical protein PAXINDRAFT_9091 [Paxillus involutus ATCC 200175]|nr:hypothetical protein PAXINDRAFT_9091 [Paxillus involutus ATCC 200175]